MDLFKPEYNILKTAGSSLGFKHSEEARAKMSASKTGRVFSEITRKRISLAHQGKKLTLETITKISAAKLGNENSKYQPTAIPVQVIDLKTG